MTAAQRKALAAARRGAFSTLRVIRMHAKHPAPNLDNDRKSVIDYATTGLADVLKLLRVASGEKEAT